MEYNSEDTLCHSRNPEVALTGDTHGNRRGKFLQLGLAGAKAIRRKREETECREGHNLRLHTVNDTGERMSDDGQSTEEAGLQSSVLRRSTSTLVAVAGSSLRSSSFIGDLVDFVCLAILDVDGANQVLLWNFLEMAMVLVLGYTSGNAMTSGCRADQYRTSIRKEKMTHRICN